MNETLDIGGYTGAGPQVAHGSWHLWTRNEVFLKR